MLLALFVLLALPALLAKGAGAIRKMWPGVDHPLRFVYLIAAFALRTLLDCLAFACCLIS